MEPNSAKTGLSHEINTHLFEFAAATIQDMTTEQLSKWFNYTKTIDDIEIVYWITPGVVLGAVIKDSDTGKRTYTVLEPNSIFISDPIPDGLHDKIDTYKQSKHSSDYKFISAVAADPFIDTCVITNDVITVNHHHCNETLRLTNTGTPIDTQQFIEQLKQRYNNQIPQQLESTLDVIQLHTEQHDTILCTTRESDSPAITIKFKNRTPHTPYDLLAEETYSPESLAYLWSMIVHGKNILCRTPTPAVTNETVEALTHFTPTTDQLITYSDTPRFNLPHENHVSLLPQHGTSLTPTDISKQISNLTPEHTAILTSNNETLTTLLSSNTTTGFITGAVSPTLTDTPTPQSTTEIELDTTTFDAITYHEYTDKGIGINKQIIEVTPTGHSETLTDTTSNSPTNITESQHITSEEITQRTAALNKLLSDRITDSHAQHTFLTKCTTHINNNTFEQMIAPNSNTS